MKYMSTWTIRPENMKAAIERFKQTGGAPPAGVKILGRWYEMGTGHGFTLSESDDPVAVARAGIEWADLIDEKIVPVIEDAQIAAALG